eukprot:CAMPEP_0194487480 /NCGR_PEP_ID=MMETSP0253-20130528/7740_1 /TAXON_ID=2966 /ORGANISM="Noctiluca scintillans" /LENGTH=351 /DNA_ID=CAMNT_0039327703 /DNA_START=6 /DNA_END=1061 /DNA_ORIENTATION=+
MRLGRGSESFEIEEARTQRAASYRAAHMILSVKVIGAAVGVCLLLMVVVALTSIGVVVPRTLGIKYNRFTKNAETSYIYEPGRYLLGPWNTFVVFPAGVQSIEFTDNRYLRKLGTRFDALHTRTKDGLALHLQLALQYRLQKANLGHLYNEFNLQYEQVFSNTIRDELVRTASQYEATHLWTARHSFNLELQAKVNNALKSMYADCWALQLIEIELPENFENSIVLTQVQKQLEETRDYEQQASVVRAKTDVLEATFDRQVTVIEAEANANFTRTTKGASALAEQRVVEAQAEVLNTFVQELSLNAEQLIQFQRYTSLRNMDEATVFVGFDDSVQGQTAMLVQTIQHTSLR